MAKQWRKTVVAAAVGSALASWGGAASASGFQLQEQGASGLGVAYSGQAAAVHDASTAFWNPAGMSLLPGKQVTGALHYIIPDTKFSSAGPLPGGSTYNAFGNGGQGGESAFVPALYGTWMINPQWTVGLAVNAPFGLGTEWDSTWAGQFHAIKSEIKTLNINPTVAFKVNNMLSLGAGLSYQQLEAELTNGVSPLVAGSTGKVEGDDWAWGWNLGALFDFGQGTRLGLTYRSTIDYTIEGDLNFSGIALPSQQVKADVELPDTFSVGISHQFNPKLRVLADYTWTGWDSIQQLVIQNRGSGATISTTELRFDNSWRVGVGVEYQLNQPWLLRAGIAYDTAPVQDAFRTPRLPDNDRTWLSVGARYQPAPNWWLDFGYTYIFVDDASSNLTPGAAGVPGNLVGTYKANVQILGAQASIRF
jgi:long-chain fatty acid transport protein